VNVVDSSAWLEYMADGPNADDFAKPIQNTAKLLVPTVVLYEVFKRINHQRGEGPALQGAALLMQGQMIDLGPDLALLAAKLGLEHRLPLADSIVFATAQHHGATVWTQDSDFEKLPDVEFRPKK
jgi:predicted nucleic acid-binding protein